jgi:tetratricopeptide (TPR) repeat protein
MSRSVLFISHNAVDRPYADALKQFLDDMLQDTNLIEVRYSTSEELGPEGGESWRDWIHRAVIEARTTLIVITPHALGKPWLLWEAGAVKGAALARAALSNDAGPRDGRARLAGVAMSPIIVSLAYALPLSECPDPFRGEQIVPGNDLKRLEELFIRILQNHGIAGNALFKAGNRIKDAFEHYLDAVETAMRRAPSLINEANVQDWLKRLDVLVAGNRLSELGNFERWMMLAFGRDPDRKAHSGGYPIDVRLHRTLGELHLGQKRYAEAVHQLRLAWRAAPRDIFVLRPLAEASMKSVLQGGDTDKPAAREEILTLLSSIRELDERAYEASPEAAALFAKYQRLVLGEPGKALETYRTALESNPDSYYLADLVSQTELELGRTDAARASFQRVLDIIERVGEQNIWSQASAATACVALGRLDRARGHIAWIREAGTSSAAEIDSIARGILEVAGRVGVGADAVRELLGAMRPSAKLPG